MPTPDVDIETRNLRLAAQEMVRRFEWVIPLFQVPVFFVSIFFDPLASGGLIFDLALLGAHAVLVGVYFRWGGTFSRDGWWFLLSYVAALAMLPLSMPFMRAGEYGTSVLGVPLFSYSIPFWPFLAFHPWPVRMRPKNIEICKLLLVGSYYPYMVVMIYIKNGVLYPRNFEAAALSFMWLAVAYEVGKCFAYMCRKVSERLVELQKRQSKTFFDSLHSDVSASVAGVESELKRGKITSDRAVYQVLDRVRRIVLDARTRLLLEQPDVDLAELVSVRVKEFRAAVELISDTRVGGILFRQSLGILFNRALGDLVSNSIKAGARRVELTIIRRGHMIQMEVADDGPGFSDCVLENDATNLSILRRDIRASGGDLAKVANVGTGAKMRVVLPLFTENRN
ncbi:MAG TPA: HAMP domain-containing sensor histidine kinase [Sphingomicrobium sp.]|nr:HAMP domain-containing sensor histidine kinase [Sphingomicrobium sp.]